MADGSHAGADAGADEAVADAAAPAADEAAVRFRDVTFVYQVSDGLDDEWSAGRDDERGDARNGAPVGARGTDERSARRDDPPDAAPGGAPPGAGGVHSLDLTIRAGECVVLCGGSGCGKTTVTRLINGLAPHFYPGEMTGRVEVCGRDVTEMPLAQTARLVGSVFQNPRSQFFNVDTDSELAFGCENLALERDETIRRVRQAVGAFSLEGLLGRSIFELSGGEKQRIACGCVHAMRPRVYLLDEPSSNLDLASVARLRDALSRLRRQGATIVIAEHRLHYLSGLADRYLYFKDGRVLTEFTPAELERLSVDERLAHGLRCLSLSRAELAGKERPASRPAVPTDASRPASPTDAPPPASRPAVPTDAARPTSQPTVPPA
jgi:energy-coupling factor transporter ATP-binding protein EcfA2